MNQAFEELCEKHELEDETRDEFKKMFEDEIIKVFYRLSVQETDVKKGKVAKTTTTKPTTKPAASKSKSGEICAGKKANGEDCTFKAKENGYCGRHDPDKLSTKKSSKLKTKKTAAHECHAIIPKTKKQCTQPGTVKPDGSDFHYCKRHSEKWTEFEEEAGDELKGSEPEDVEEEDGDGEEEPEE